MEEIKNSHGENNADLAIKRLRVFQSSLYSDTKTTRDLLNETNEIIKIMEDASKEIRVNYEEVSKSLTDLMNGKRRNKVEK